MPKEKTPTLEENLRNPVYVNYNLLNGLEQIKESLREVNNYLLQVSQLINYFAQKVEEEKKEEREGVFKNQDG